MVGGGGVLVKNTTSQDPPLEILTSEVSVGSQIICRLTSTEGEPREQFLKHLPTWIRKERKRRKKRKTHEGGQGTLGILAGGTLKDDVLAGNRSALKEECERLNWPP